MTEITMKEYMELDSYKNSYSVTCYNSLYEHKNRCIYNYKDECNNDPNNIFCCQKCYVTQKEFMFLKTCSKANIKKIDVNVPMLNDLDADIFKGISEVAITNSHNISDLFTYQMTWCKKVHFENCCITDKSVIYLSKLKYLSFDSCKHITDNSVKLLTEAKYLNLSNNEQLTDASFSLLGNVKTLILKNCINITDFSVSKYTEVKILNISGCTNITDASVRLLKKVKKLGMDDVNLITDESIKILTQLKYLSIRSCTNISDNSLLKLKNCEYLIISGCININSYKLIKKLKKIIEIIFCTLRDLNNMFNTQAEYDSYRIIEEKRRKNKKIYYSKDFL